MFILLYKGVIISIDVVVNSKYSGVRDVYFDKCVLVNFLLEVM